MFRCPMCQWSNYQRLNVKLHMREAHIETMLAEQRAALTPQATLYDANGALITQMPGGVDESEIKAAFADPND